MDETEAEKLYRCISPTNVKEPKLGDTWMEYQKPGQYNELTGRGILHVKNEIILDLKSIQDCVKNNNLEMKSLRDEWIIYEPRKPT